MEWDENRWCRCRLCGRPALAQLGAALAAGVARGVVLMDASYGTNSALRAGIGALALTYVAAILPTVKVREVGDPDRRVSAKQLALTLPNHTWRTITWRDGSADPLRSRFARVRVRTAPIRGAAARPEETLLIEWQHGEAAPPSIGFRMLPRRFHSGNCSTSPKSWRSSPSPPSVQGHALDMGLDARWVRGSVDDRSETRLDRLSRQGGLTGWIAEETPGHSFGHSFRRTEREQTQTNLTKKC